MAQTVVNLIERNFSLYSSKVAIRIHDNMWTYSKLQDLSSQIANFLLKSGMKKGDRVVVLLNKSIYLYGAIIGILQGGGVYVPLDTRTPSERLAKILEDVSPCCVFIDRYSTKPFERCQKLMKNQFKACYLDDGRHNGYEEIRPKEESIRVSERFPSIVSEDLAFVLYTSGSTGVPKGAMITHGNLHNIIRYTIKTFIYGPGEVGSALNANAFDMSIADMLPVLCSGGTLGVYPEEIIFPKDILELTYKYEITKMFLVPSLLTSLVSSNLMQPALLNLKDVFLGGEMIPVNILMNAMAALPRSRFHNCYGPTETTLYTSKYTFGEAPNLQTTILPIGFPIANNSFILDTTDFESQQMKGELLIAGPQVGLGYWGDPGKTKNAFGVTDTGERYYRTGDIASLDPTVGYFIHGRKDNQIKFMGYRIELGEIEHILSLLPLVKENVVIPVYAKSRIKELRLVYSGDRDCNQEIRRHLNKHLPSYMVPKSLIRVESLPKNQSNKIDRALIKEIYG